MQRAVAVLALCAGGLALGVETHTITLTVLRGEARFNDMRRKTPEDIVVQVLDQTGKPVTGAQVTFTAPAIGAGGSFRDGGKTLSVDSDQEGKATAPGFRPNVIEGRFAIRVNASYQGKTASTLIWQSNTIATGSKGGSRKTLLLLALAGGAIAGGVVAATGGSSTQPAPTPVPVPVPTSLSVGSVTIGPPR
jgi:hypothetical protein